MKIKIKYKDHSQSTKTIFSLGAGDQIFTFVYQICWKRFECFKLYYGPIPILHGCQ